MSPFDISAMFTSLRLERISLLDETMLRIRDGLSTHDQDNRLRENYDSTKSLAMALGRRSTDGRRPAWCYTQPRS